ncbi:MAG: tRNA (N6-threonylcarbamoyladenosine(37)-N6)-methyltransferase TrmO [Desulfobacteraceae bacterium]|nr:tRNA (N6-threonylcarbamoyladenosine(37)-N6)-methyltransferase TrmO [Desulfobacteraceae bacterium]
MEETRYVLRPVGVVRSSLVSRESCPKQGWEGAPEAWLEIDPAFADGLDGLSVGAEILILTWLHEGRRDVLRVHPRGNPDAPLRGVFATRSPDRPNPVGLHRVTVTAIGEGTIGVRPLEALDHTPVIDIKPVLHQADER